MGSTLLLLQGIPRLKGDQLFSDLILTGSILLVLKVTKGLTSSVKFEGRKNQISPCLEREGDF